MPNGLKPNLTTYVYCKQCGRVIVWDDWGYVHLDGWANCRDSDKPDTLGNTHADPDFEHPIDLQPATFVDAYNIPIRKVSPCQTS